MQETQVRSLDREDPLEESLATHLSILAWRIPWTEEPGGLQSMGSQRVGQTERLSMHAYPSSLRNEIFRMKNHSGRIHLPNTKTIFFPNIYLFG